MARPPPRQDLQPGVQPQLFLNHGLSSGESLLLSLRSMGAPCRAVLGDVPLPWDALGSATSLGKVLPLPCCSLRGAGQPCSESMSAMPSLGRLSRSSRRARGDGSDPGPRVLLGVCPWVVCTLPGPPAL